MTEEDVKKLLGENKLSWSDFLEWMTGQTVSCDEKGNPIYWTHDVQRFIYLKKSGTREAGFD